MISLLTVPKAQGKLAEYTRARRLATGLTQEGLAKRSGVSLPTLRKFEQKGLISLESFLKLMVVLDGLEPLLDAVKPRKKEFASIDDVLAKDNKTRKKGWRK